MRKLMTAADFFLVLETVGAGAGKLAEGVRLECWREFERARCVWAEGASWSKAAGSGETGEMGESEWRRGRRGSNDEVSRPGMLRRGLVWTVAMSNGNEDAKDKMRADVSARDPAKGGGVSSAEKRP